MSPGLVDRFLPVAIGAALLIALHQLVDVYGAMAGLDLATAAGRMGLVNTVAARLPAFIVADVLLVLAAVRAADSGIARAASRSGSSATARFR